MPNPLRRLGVARIVSGAWFIYNAVTIGRQFGDLQPQAARLFTGETGTTDAPIRALLMLVLAAALAILGAVMLAQGFRWTRRVALPRGGPAALERDDVIGTLMRRHPLAYGDGLKPPHPLLVRLLPDQLADMPWWCRDQMTTAVRAVARAAAFSATIAVCCVAISVIVGASPLGPFPAGFILTVPFVTGVWAVLTLMLIPSHGPRVESVELPLTRRALGESGRIIESPPRLLPHSPSGVGLALGFVGVAVQSLLPVWWNLSSIGYPALATSIIRHAGSVAGGIVFFALGGLILAAAAAIIMHFRYESMLIYLKDADHGTTGYAAELRSESLDLAGPRYVISAAANSHVHDTARQLITQ